MRTERLVSDKDPTKVAPTDKLPVGWVAVQSIKLVYLRPTPPNNPPEVRFTFSDLHFESPTALADWLKEKIK